MKEFTQARMKLFSWYVLISFLLLTAFTIVAFQAEKQSFAQIDQMLQSRVKRPVMSAVLEQRLAEFSGSFRERLLYFDLILFLTSTAASWFLSGRTLKPIEAMLQKQQEFSADASHELRTPITTIMMEVEALKRSKIKLPNEVNDSLQVIKEESTRMKKLVNNLLSLVRTDHHVQKLSTSFELNEIIQNVVQKLQEQANNKDLDLMFQKSSSLQIFGDKDAIHQAITILLDNAIKFTLLGSVTITISRQHYSAIVVITDTGIGIHENDIPHIFDRFYRIKSRVNAQGSGLGLSIAQKIIKEHDGKITVKSKADVGSTFTIFLPIAS